MTLAQQFTLWGDTDVVRTEPCDACGIGVIVVKRTRDPWTDEWKCRECHLTGVVSHSREFGARFNEVHGHAN